MSNGENGTSGTSLEEPNFDELFPYKPAPLERFGAFIRRRIANGDWTDDALIGAVVLLIASSIGEVLLTATENPLKYALPSAGSAGFQQLALLRPALAVLVLAHIRSRRSRVSLLRRAVRASVAILSVGALWIFAGFYIPQFFNEGAFWPWWASLGFVVLLPTVTVVLVAANAAMARVERPLR